MPTTTRKGGSSKKKKDRPLPTPTPQDSLADASNAAKREWIEKPEGFREYLEMCAGKPSSVPASMLRPQTFAPEDGDQTPIRNAPARVLRKAWAECMDFRPYQLMPRPGQPTSLWSECFTADRDALLRRTDWSGLEARHSQLRLSPLMCIIQGARNEASPSDYAAALAALLPRRPNLNARDVIGTTPLMMCTNLGCNARTLPLAKALIAAGADINAQTRLGTTALFDPVIQGNLELVRLLLDAGIDYDIKEYEGPMSVRDVSHLRPAVHHLVVAAAAKRARDKARAAGPGRCAGGCGQAGTKRCARCGTASYCSADCQRAHWRAGHKSECKVNGVTVLTIPVPDGEVLAPLCPLPTAPGTCPPPGEQMVVKVQTRPAPDGRLVVYDKTRTYVRYVEAESPGTAALREGVQAEGVLGCKAYYHAVASPDGRLAVAFPALVPKTW